MRRQGVRPLPRIAVALATALLLASCASSQTHHPHSACGSGPAVTSAVRPPAGSIAASAPATAARIRAILRDMSGHAFNPQAPPAGGASRRGGLFINWRGTWRGGFATAAANTNIQENGLPDQLAGKAPRHDPLTDLTYLVDLCAYQAVSPGDREFALDVSRMSPVVRQEFAKVGYYRCWVYFQFRDLGGLQPGQGWDALADRYASRIYQHFYNERAGTVADPRHDGVYRTDYAAECGAMLIDAGQRQHNAQWIGAGDSTLAHLLQRAQNPRTHLFPLQLKLGPTRDTIVQAQLKVGAEAQLLNSFLDAYDLTGNKSYLAAVTRAVSALYSPAVGLFDKVRGGFFFSVDADGRGLNAHYKESRQAWMLPLLEHLARIEAGGVWAGRERQMLFVVRDKLWQPSIHGYPYRETASFAVYRSDNGPGRTHVAENWVSAEAMGITCESLVSQLLPLRL